MNYENNEKFEKEYNKCVESLQKKEIERTPQDIKNIKTYLSTLLYFQRLKSFDPNNYDNLFSNISKVIKYGTVPKNNYIFKIGEKCNTFYLILKGKVTIMIVEYKKIYLNIEDYLIFLLKLYYYKENELLKETILLNIDKYAIEEKFEIFIKNLYIKHKLLEIEKIKNQKKNNMKIESKNIFSENFIKMIEKIFPNLITLPEVKDINNQSIENNNKYNIFLEKVLKENYEEGGVTPDKIISLINLDNYNIYEKNLFKCFTIPFYYKIDTLEKGKYFGHSSLETNTKSTITIITSQDSHFGIIEKKDYFNLLSKINKEIENNFYNAIYRLPFFKDIPKSIFRRFYSSFFDYHLYTRNHILYEMNEKTDIMYLINNGSYTVSFSGNIIDIYNILIYLKEEKNKKLNKKKNNLLNDKNNEKNKISEIEEREDILYNKNYKSQEFNDAVFSQREINLGFFEGNSLLGLAETINKITSKSLFNIRIESNIVELYEITHQNFNTIISDYSSVKNIIEEFEIIKIDLIINKIITYKNNFFQSLIKKENYDISVRRNIIKKEKENNIHNKTQKALKNCDININDTIFLKINTDRAKRTHKIKFHTINDDKNTLFNSKKNLKSQTINNNYSEKKRIMLIKQTIIEKQNNIFLLEFGDIGYKNKVLKFKKKLFFEQTPNQSITSNKEMSMNNDSKKFDNSIKKNKKNYNLILNKNLLDDKINHSIYNNIFKIPNNLPNIIQRGKKSINLNTNLFKNKINNYTPTKLIINDKKNIYRKINISVGTRENNFNNYKENNKHDRNQSEITNNDKLNKIRQKIVEFNIKKKAIFNKLKSNINKLQKDINSSTSYLTERQRFKNIKEN